MPDNPIRILIADDHAVVRKGLVMVLRLEADFEVIGEAGNGQEAADLARALHPDVVLLDRMMPVLDGGEAATAIKKDNPDTHIIILTGTEVDPGVIDILSLGIDGYVLKEIEPGELKNAIRTVARGEPYLHPNVTRLVLNQITKQPRPADLLTSRELEVLRWMSTAATYREIGDELSISEETVRSHAKHILSKLGQPNRTGAVLEAGRLGLLESF